ncbi:MAG: 4-hydroxyphenylpyruvate dioxygenase [Elainellaceae cyanobacterium]
MDINHIHFYAHNAHQLRSWFVEALGFHFIGSFQTHHDSVEIIRSHHVLILVSSPLTEQSSVARYLRQHPDGVAIVGFRVSNIEAMIERAIAHGAKLVHPLQVERRPTGVLKWAQVQGWGEVIHTLVEPCDVGSLQLLPIPDMPAEVETHYWAAHSKTHTSPFVTIDHVVLNVATGDLDRVVSWYEHVFGLQRQQEFTIQTDRSALHSRVLKHPNGTLQFPINEPASSSSQIQEFLDINRGPGIQHIALQTSDIIQTIARLRQTGISFLRVPDTYYAQLRDRPGFRPSHANWEAIAQHEILVDWSDDNPDAMLLQTFTQPIFEQPTFFFEIIQRQTYSNGFGYRQAYGFGEGNFQALFEAMEQEQIRRGSI